MFYGNKNQKITPFSELIKKMESFHNSIGDIQNAIFHYLGECGDIRDKKCIYTKYISNKYISEKFSIVFNTFENIKDIYDHYIYDGFLYEFEVDEIKNEYKKFMKNMYYLFILYNTICKFGIENFNNKCKKISINVKKYSIDIQNDDNKPINFEDENPGFKEELDNFYNQVEERYKINEVTNDELERFEEYIEDDIKENPGSN